MKDPVMAALKKWLRIDIEAEKVPYYHNWYILMG
jgi:hypothetical protein